MEQGGTILIVDDEAMIREFLDALLATEGYNLAFATNGAEGLAKARELTPDLILLDVMMPDMDGFEVCRELRSDPGLTEIPIIMVTGLDDKESRLEGIEAGANDFVTKPFNGAELRARVRTITRLNRHRQIRTLELQAERDRTRAILEALGEAVVVTDVAGVIQYQNPAATALTGYKDKEALGQSWRLWQSNDHENLFDKILEIVRNGQTWRGEVVNKRKDGATYDAALTVAPLFSSDDPQTLIGFVSVQRDITPLKEAERSKTKFVSDVSHELRTPLSVITLLGDNLDTLYDRLDNDKRRQMIRDIQKHTEALNNLVDDILEISRIDSGRVSMERERVDLTQLTHEEVNRLRPIAEQKSQDLQITGAEPLPIWGNTDQLRQVIRNLVNNAIKYTPEGGQISCECLVYSNLLSKSNWAAEYRPANITPANNEQWAILRVTDNGIGISKEHLPNLFGRFYRVKTQGNIRGTGLGLSIARELTELHLGFITVASSVNVGAEFTVYLPMLVKE